MSFTVRMDGRDYGVPRTVEAGGAAAVSRWIAEQRATEAPRPARPRKRKARPAPTPEISTQERES